ncbi:MAG: tRNA uridine-5-carboxymethylaminomethyl(34) synthesis enzyme MnmG [Deltaproteobacteria bacterium]|nr:tRNA uridine-5-carboxymethylaminomethyl(34) synthesis enzyme MnmG [Deltaproteobacteria bacterium]
MGAYVRQGGPYDVLVIGAGHAGTEAALVAARMGAKTALLTFTRNTIGQMSCNPAIGGLGKGQLVKEIDALFGEMGVAIDDTGIQFRTLNGSKGPAVRSSRAQADRDLYKARVRQACEACPNLDIIEAAAGGFLVEGIRVVGAHTEDGVPIRATCTVMTTGTFLRGLMHTGTEQTPGGRVDDQAAYPLSDSLRSLGLRMGRMKTGTPPRLIRSTIDFSKLVEQPGDTPIVPFSFRTKKIERPQISCWITETNAHTHDIIAANVERSPMFNGQIESGGPRYCPSIEDKVFRFRDKTSHNIFLEPEGFESDVVYPNGISTSLPADVQESFVRSIPGLEGVQFLKFGYAVEYDHIDPTELDARLAPRAVQGIFFAGQINGTSGYEEAGAQGLLAGINAAQEALGREAVTFRREESYIGVMVDDLISRGVSEPYRMFTSRAEYRLHLREDNADSRLTPTARRLGLVDDAAFALIEARWNRMTQEKLRFENTVAKPFPEVNAWLGSVDSAALSDAVRLSELIRRPELGYEQIVSHFGAAAEPLDERDWKVVETELKFAGYLRRQEEDIARVRRMEDVLIPEAIPYSEMNSLSVEVRETLSRHRPRTLGQASRLSGVTPAALSLLSIYLRKGLPGASATPERE